MSITGRNFFLGGRRYQRPLRVIASFWGTVLRNWCPWVNSINVDDSAGYKTVFTVGEPAGAVQHGPVTLLRPPAGGSGRLTPDLNSSSNGGFNDYGIIQLGLHIMVSGVFSFFQCYAFQVRRIAYWNKTGNYWGAIIIVSALFVTCRK